MSQGVADLVSHHGRERIFRLGDGKDSRIDDDLAPRQAEGVDLFALDDIAFPLEIRRLESRGLHEARIADAATNSFANRRTTSTTGWFSSTCDFVRTWL